MELPHESQIRDNAARPGRDASRPLAAAFTYLVFEPLTTDLRPRAPFTLQRHPYIRTSTEYKYDYLLLKPSTPTS